MSTTYSVIMMLLLLAASIVGIGSTYKSANVEAQPQPQQQQQQQPQQPAAKPLSKAFLAQAAEDRALVDRLFPYIIQKLDGQTLLQKIDARTLAAKVLPYLDLSASVRLRSGSAGILNVQDIARDLGLTGPELRTSTARCNTGETAIGGGFSFQSDPEDSYVSSVSPTQQNGWHVAAQLGDNGKIQAFVACFTVKAALKSGPVMDTTAISSEIGKQVGGVLPQPPGGPPLQPPPNLRK